MPFDVDKGGLSGRGPKKIRASQVFSTAIAVVYVWSMVPLSLIGFTNRCHNWPNCSRMGVTIPSLIDTPQATGAMASLCFYPLLHAWLNLLQFRHGTARYERVTLIAFHSLFGAFLMCPYRTVLSNIIVIAFSLSALAHYGTLLLHCASDRFWCCLDLLGVACIAFVCHFSLMAINLVSNVLLDTHEQFLSYILESAGLTIMIVFPLCWYHEHFQHDEGCGKLDTQATQPMEDTSSAYPTITLLNVIGAFLPIMFIFSLIPLGWIGFAHRCQDWPACGPKGVSVSNCICTPHATGGMAATFFYPCLRAWEHAKQVAHEVTTMKKVLIVFQASFSAFLMCPVNQKGALHGMFVMTFGSIGLIYCFIMFRHCARDRHLHCKASLALATLSFASMGVLSVVGHLEDTFLVNHAPFAFYFAECTGLSGMIIYVLVWRHHSSQSISAYQTVGSKESSAGNHYQPVTTAPPFVE